MKQGIEIEAGNYLRKSCTIAVIKKKKARGLSAPRLRKLCRTAVLLRRLIYSFALRPKPSHSLSILPLCFPALRLKFSQNSLHSPVSSPSSYCATKFLGSVAHIGRRRFHQFVPRFPSTAPVSFHFPFRSGCTINFLSSRVNCIFSFSLCKSVHDCANVPECRHASNVHFPPAIVRSTGIVTSVEGSSFTGSLPSTTKSATFPPSNDPFKFSSNDAYAP